MKARDFRQRALADGLSLKTPDAIHLATAATYKAEFWTFDDRLLRLNGDERVDHLNGVQANRGAAQSSLRTSN